MVKEHEFVMRLQTGVLRTNCVDCLDRTNYFQGIIGERVLTRQINEVLHNKCHINRDFSFISKSINEEFRVMWRKQGDALSLQYGGSKAHRHKQEGKWEKLVKSAKRHFSNSFWDPNKQYQINIFTGDSIPKDKKDYYNFEVQNKFQPDELLINFLSSRHHLQDYCKNAYKLKPLFKNSWTIGQNLYLCHNTIICNGINRGKHYEFHSSNAWDSERLERNYQYLNSKKKSKKERGGLVASITSGITGNGMAKTDNDIVLNVDITNIYVSDLDLDETKLLKLKEEDKIEDSSNYKTNCYID